MSGGGGSANAAQGQIQADELRGNPDVARRWGAHERRRMLFALSPLVVVAIVAFLLSR